MGAAETYLRLALRAQGQCRATIETLAAIKNPQPLAFVRQANISHGPQQINNTTTLGDPPRAKEIESGQNKLLEDQSRERLDFSPACSASVTDPPMETLDMLHRAKDRER